MTSHLPPASAPRDYALLERRVKELERQIRARPKPRYRLAEMDDVKNTLAPVTNNALVYDGSEWTAGTPVIPATGVTSFNSRTGAVVLSSGDVTGALGYTPVSSFNSRTGAVVLSSGDVTGALGYTPVNKAGDSMSGVLTMNANLVANGDIVANSHIDIGGKLYQAGLPGEISFETQGTFVQGNLYAFGNVYASGAILEAVILGGSDNTIGRAARLQMRTNNRLTVGWVNGFLEFWVDTTLVKTL